MIYGQEMNPTTYNLARMNIILHDVNYRNFDIRNENTLNIPRYVDAFEEEEPVDLAAVAQELRDLQTETAGLDRELAGYCQELGIDTPF